MTYRDATHLKTIGIITLPHMLTLKPLINYYYRHLFWSGAPLTLRPSVRTSVTLTSMVTTGPWVRRVHRGHWSRWFSQVI